MTARGQAYLATRHDEVAAALKRGESNLEIAERFGVRYDHVGRYCRNRDLYRFIPDLQKGASHAEISR